MYRSNAIIAVNLPAKYRKNMFPWKVYFRRDGKHIPLEMQRAKIAWSANPEKPTQTSEMLMRRIKRYDKICSFLRFRSAWTRNKFTVMFVKSMKNIKIRSDKIIPQFKYMIRPWFDSPTDVNFSFSKIGLYHKDLNLGHWLHHQPIQMKINISAEFPGHYHCIQNSFLLKSQHAVCCEHQANTVAKNIFSWAEFTRTSQLFQLTAAPFHGPTRQHFLNSVNSLF